MPYNAVIFDLDGTLLDTLQDLADSTNAVLTRHGYPRRATCEFRTIVGDGIQKQVLRALPEGERKEATATRLLPEVRQEYARRWKATTHPYPGAPELLDALSERGSPMAVLSNKPDDFTQKVVGELLGQWDFQVVRGALAGVPLKPDPAAALAVACELGLPPERIAYVGDTNTDMQTAVAAGMYAVGALWGFRDAAELRANGADDLIEEPLDLLPLLG